MSKFTYNLLSYAVLYYSLNTYTGINMTMSPFTHFPSQLHCGLPCQIPQYYNQPPHLLGPSDETSKMPSPYWTTHNHTILLTLSNLQMQALYFRLCYINCVFSFNTNALTYMMPPSFLAPSCSFNACDL